MINTERFVPDFLARSLAGIADEPELLADLFDLVSKYGRDLNRPNCRLLSVTGWDRAPMNVIVCDDSPFAIIVQRWDYGADADKLMTMSLGKQSGSLNVEQGYTVDDLKAFVREYEFLSSADRTRYGARRRMASDSVYAPKVPVDVQFSTPNRAIAFDADKTPESALAQFDKPEELGVVFVDKETSPAGFILMRKADAEARLLRDEATRRVVRRLGVEVLRCTDTSLPEAAAEIRRVFEEELAAVLAERAQERFGEAITAFAQQAAARRQGQ